MCPVRGRFNMLRNKDIIMGPRTGAVLEIPGVSLPISMHTPRGEDINPRSAPVSCNRNLHGSSQILGFKVSWTYT